MAKTLLIDTHALLWWLADDRRLPRSVKDSISDPESVALISAVSAWEVSVKKSLGKLTAPADLIEVVKRSGFDWIPLLPGETYAAGELALHHRDPFDRLLIAQAFAHDAALVSKDEILDQYGVERRWS